ncbi:MAG: hypothetical protein WCD52_23435 [Xanthobacteraceae bacterium]
MAHVLIGKLVPTFPGHARRQPARFRMRALCALIGAILLASGGGAEAGFIDDSSNFSLAISMLRGAVGTHARVLKIEGDANGIEIEAQDPKNPGHIDRWRYGIVNYLGMIPLRHLTGPRRSPGISIPTISSGIACTRTSASRSWSSSAA